MTATVTASDPDLRAFLRHIGAERRLSPHTVAAYRLDITGFVGFLSGYFGSRQWGWSDVDARAIRARMAELSELGRRASTVARHLSSLRSFFRFLVRTDRLAKNPARRIRATRGARPLPGHLRPGQVDELFTLLEERVEEGVAGALWDLALVELALALLRSLKFFATYSNGSA